MESNTTSVLRVLGGIGLWLYTPKRVRCGQHKDQATLGACIIGDGPDTDAPGVELCCTGVLTTFAAETAAAFEAFLDVLVLRDIKWGNLNI